MRRFADFLLELLGYIAFGIACLAFAIGSISIIGMWPNWTLAIALSAVIALVLIFAIVKCNLLSSTRTPQSTLEWIRFLTALLVITTITYFGLGLVLEPKRASLFWSAITALFQGFMVFLIWLWRREQTKKQDAVK